MWREGCVSTGEIEKHIRTEVVSTRIQLQRLADVASKDCASFGEYRERMRGVGVERAHPAAGGHRLTGLMYRLDGATKKGSDLGKGYGPAGLAKRGVSYERSSDAGGLAGDGAPAGACLVLARQQWRRCAQSRRGRPGRPPGAQGHATLNKKHGADFLTLAGLWVPPDGDTKHFKLIGTTGSGKSTAIRELMGQALARGDRAVFADPDGGYVTRLYDPSRGDVILNPFDPRSAKWNPLLDVDNDYEADLLANDYEADLLAKALVPGESEWNGYARTFVAAMVRQCKATKRTDPAELWRLVAVAPADELRELLEGVAAQPLLVPENGRMFGSIRAVASNATAALQYVNEQHGPGFSVRAWVRDGRGALFMPYQAEQIAALKSLIPAWARLAIFQDD